MAILAPITGAPTRASEINRRHLLAGLAAVPALAGLPAAGAKAFSKEDALWAAAMAELLDAKLAYQKAEPVFDAALKARRATAPDEGMVEWRVLEGLIPNPKHVRSVETGPLREKTLRHIEKGYFRFNPDIPERRLTALDQLDAYRLAVVENEQRHAAVYAPAQSAFDAAVEWVGRCEQRLMSMPAPDVAALLWKVEHIVDDDGDGYTSSWSLTYAQPLIDDARRLAARNTGAKS